MRSRDKGANRIAKKRAEYYAWKPGDVAVEKSQRMKDTKRAVEKDFWDFVFPGDRERAIIGEEESR